MSIREVLEKLLACYWLRTNKDEPTELDGHMNISLNVASLRGSAEQAVRVSRQLGGEALDERLHRVWTPTGEIPAGQRLRRISWKRGNRPKGGVRIEDAVYVVSQHPGIIYVFSLTPVGTARCAEALIKLGGLELRLRELGEKLKLLPSGATIERAIMYLPNSHALNDVLFDNPPANEEFQRTINELEAVLHAVVVRVNEENSDKQVRLVSVGLYPRSIELHIGTPRILPDARQEPASEFTWATDIARVVCTEIPKLDDA